MNGIQNRFKIRSALVQWEQVRYERIRRDYRYNNLSVYRYNQQGNSQQILSIFYGCIEQVLGY